jgi:hypothetical protein
VADRATLAVGGLFLLLGTIFGGVALYLWSAVEERQLAAEGRTARAELLRKDIVADRASGSIVRPGYRVHYRFTPQQGSPVSASAQIDEALWRRLSPGDALEVRYLDDDPAAHRVESQQRDIVLPVVFGLIGAVFAPLGLCLVLGRSPFPPGFADWVGRSPAYALGIIGVLFFMPFAGGGIFWLDAVRSEQALFDARGQQAEGTVLSKAIVKKSSGSSSGPGRSRSQSTHYQVTYRFQGDAGEEVAGTSELDVDDWERLKERGPVAVTYVAGRPWLHRVQGWEPAWIAPILFLVVGGAGVLACGGLAWWARGRPARRIKPRKPVPMPTAPQPIQEIESRKPNRSWWWGAGIGAVFFFAGCGASVDGIGELLKERRYAAEGKSVEARIVAKRIDEAQRGGRSRTEYVALYRFDAPEGAKGEGRAVLEVAAWEAARPGDRLAVRYLPGEPGSNRPAGEGGWAYGIIISIVGPLFALIGAFLAWGSWLARHDGDAR